MIFAIVMGISGIYAATFQITDSNFRLGNVNITIQISKLNSDGMEVKYEDDSRVVTPAEVISFIPKIGNNGDSCYIRVHIFYINESIDASAYITGISDEWEKHGDYYYYKKAVLHDDTVKLFNTIQIPENVSELTNSGKIKLEVTAEAVQARNFMPDYTGDDPWQGIVPVQSVNTEYNIDTSKDNNITINYENGADNDIDASKFFENVKNIMPGDSYSTNIIINNTRKKNARYYIALDLDKLGETEVSLLDELDLILTNETEKVVYSGRLKNVDHVLLGEYDIGEVGIINMKLLVPNELANKYAGLSPKLNCTFSVEYDKHDADINNDSGDNSKGNNGDNKISIDNDIKKNENNSRTSPQTGDKINLAIAIFLISFIGLIIVMLLDYKEKRYIE